MKKTGSAFMLSVLLLLAGNKIFSQQNTMAKASLNHIALSINDLKISTSFYQNIIGLDTIPEPFHDGRHTWFSIGPKNHLHLIQGAGGKTEQNKNSHICFTVPSVDAFTITLRRNNIEYENWSGEKNTITVRIDGVKQIYFRDPDGYWIEINDAKE